MNREGSFRSISIEQKKEGRSTEAGNPGNGQDQSPIEGKPPVDLSEFRAVKEIKIDNPDSGEALMRSSRSLDEWNANTLVVQAAYGGEYPKWWYERIVASGLLAEVRSRWE